MSDAWASAPEAMTVVRSCLDGTALLIICSRRLVIRQYIRTLDCMNLAPKECFCLKRLSLRCWLAFAVEFTNVSHEQGFRRWCIDIVVRCRHDSACAML